MSLPSNGQHRHDIDAYVDHLLDEHEAANFERRLTQEPELRAELQRQVWLDRRLSRLYQPPAPQRVLAAIQARQPADDARPSWFVQLLRSRRALAYAAVLVFVIGSGWLLRGWLMPPAEWNPYARHPFDEIYAHDVATGFKAKWICESDWQFANTFWENLGQPLAMLPPPPNVQANGISYCYTLSERTTYLLAYVNSKPVIVFVDRKRADQPPSVDPDSGLHAYRREIGDLVLYEVTPLEEPQVLNLLYEPEVSEEWLEHGSGSLPSSQPTTQPKWRG